MKVLRVVLLSVLTAFVAVSAQAQKITWDHQNTDTVFAPETHPDVESHNKITVQDSGLYRWVRKVTTNCPITTAICDKNQCYLEHVDSAVFYTDANETFTMIAHFYPNKDCCKYAQIELTVYKVSDPSVTSTATYQISLWCTQNSVSDVLGADVTLQPNPTSGILIVDGLLSTATLRVTNQLGQTIKLAENSNGAIDVADLTPGVYQLLIHLDDAVIRRQFIKQ